MPSGGSHPRYSDALRDLIESQLQCGIPQIDIVRSLRVSKSWVSNLRSNFDCYGTVSPPPVGVQGRPRKVNAEAEEGIVDFLEEYPTARLDEVCDFLNDEYDVRVSRNTAGRVLHRLNQTSKVARRVHTEQDPEVRALFMANLT